MPTAASETSPETTPKMYGKTLSAYIIYTETSNPTVFRLCWLVTCASRPNRIGMTKERVVRGLAAAAAPLGESAGALPPLLERSWTQLSLRCTAACLNPH